MYAYQVETLPQAERFIEQHAVIRQLRSGLWRAWLRMGRVKQDGCPLQYLAPNVMGYGGTRPLAIWDAAGQIECWASAKQRELERGDKRE